MDFSKICFALLCFIVAGAAQCPSSLPKDSDIISNGTKCYEFVLHHRNDWGYASGYCAKNGGNLVTIENKDENDFIMATLKSLNFRGKGVWIGLNDRRKEGHYEWLEGNTPATFTNWASGQPGQFFGLNEDCVLLMFHSLGKWHDYHCYDEFLTLPEHDGWVCQYGNSDQSSSTPSMASTMAVKSTVHKTMAVTSTVPTTMAVTSTMPTTVAVTSTMPTTMAVTSTMPTTMAVTSTMPTTMVVTSTMPTTMADTSTVPTTMAVTSTMPTTMADTSTMPTTMGVMSTMPTKMVATSNQPTPLVIG